MGAVREWFDVVGGVRSGLKDEPPWWAPAAIAVFGALVVGVVAVSLAFGVGGGGSPESARLRAGPAAAPGPEAVAAPAGEATRPGGPEPAGDDDDAAGGETVALADRTGTFQQVPQAAVVAARAAGADRLGLPVDSVRHQLVSTTAAGVELTVASLDGRQVVTVTAVPGRGGAWQVP